MKNYLMYAIESLAPNSDYVIFGDEYSGIEWRDKVNTKPTEIGKIIVKHSEIYHLNLYQNSMIMVIWICHQ